MRPFALLILAGLCLAPAAGRAELYKVERSPEGARTP